MTPAQASRKLYAIYRALEEEEIRGKINRKLGKVFGMVTPKEEWWELQLNPCKPWRTKGGFVHTIIHEMAHITWWDKSEDEIEELEKDLFNNLTDRQIGNLIKRVFNAAF